MDSYGEVTATTTALSETTYYYYETYGNLDEVADPFSHSTTITLGELVRVTEVKDATWYCTTTI